MLFPFILMVDFVANIFFYYCLFLISNPKTYITLKMHELTQILNVSLSHLCELITLFADNAS